MDHRFDLRPKGRNAWKFYFHIILLAAFRYYLFFLNIIFQFAFIKKILSICFICQVPSILKILNQSFYLFFFPPLCKTKNAGPVPFPAFVGRLSHDRSSSVSHRYKSTAESSSPYSLSPKTVTQVIVTHVMYDIIICIHIWMCLYNRVYYTHIHKTFYTGQQMECSRDSCHHMRYIDCSSAMILGTSRLLSAPDPPSGSDIGSKEYSRTPPRYYYYLSATFFFLWSNLWSTLVCCVFVPRKPSETTSRVLSLRIIFEEISFSKNYFLLFFND